MQVAESKKQVRTSAKKQDGPFGSVINVNRRLGKKGVLLRFHRPSCV